jgi:hypothetical protein
MNVEESEQKKLVVIRISGWINVLIFVVLLMTAKNNSTIHQFFTYITAAICVIGTIALYGFWDKLFVHQRKEDADSYIKPYRFGSIIIFFGALYILGVRFIGV